MSLWSQIAQGRGTGVRYKRLPKGATGCQMHSTLTAMAARSVTHNQYVAYLWSIAHAA